MPGRKEFGSALPQVLALTAWMVSLSGCGKSDPIRVDGSSTVFLITAAVYEEFNKVNPEVNVAVAYSGTGGGFKRFVVGETQISDASRPIKPTEIEQATQNGIGFIELPVAYDGLSVVVHAKNDFVDHLTVDELRRIWEPGSTVMNWKDIRPEWPDRAIRLYGPGTDSGTFDYFTEAIMGKEDASRADYTASEDDNALVQGIEGDPDSLGYFGYAYFVENRDKLKLIPIDSGNGPVAPSEETIRSQSYKPLSRPLFIYVSDQAVKRPDVQAFVEFYLKEVPKLVSTVGYVPLEPESYELATARFAARKLGSMYAGEGHGGGRPLKELLQVADEPSPQAIAR